MKTKTNWFMLIFTVSILGFVIQNIDRQSSISFFVWQFKIASYLVVLISLLIGVIIGFRITKDIYQD